LYIKTLADDKYQVVAVVVNGDCPVEQFLTDGEVSTKSWREALMQMLMSVAESGLQTVPHKWSHEANKREQIYEFIKGPLRLFYFKGEGRQIAVCTTGVRKSGKKADKAAVARAAKMRAAYFEAVESKCLQVMSDETE
jgi:hypothetical protein